MAFKTDQIKLKEDYANDAAAGTPSNGTLALIGATGSKELKIRDDGAWVAISGGGGSSLSNVVEDTTPQLGGNLDANGNDIDMGTNVITDVKVGQWDTAHGWGDHGSEGYLTSETFTSVVQDTTPELGGDLVTDGNKIAHATGGASSELTFTHTWNGETSHTHLASVKSIDFYLDQNGGDTGQAIRVYNNLNPNVHAPDDTNYIWKLHESGAMYMTNDIDMGTNVITDAKVADWDAAYAEVNAKTNNWDAAFTWGDHSAEGYISQQSDIKTSLASDYSVPDNVGHNIIAITGDPSSYKFIFTKSNLGNWSQTGQQKVEIINASSFSQTIDGDGGASPASFYLINTATSGLGSITIDPHQKATIIPNMSDNSGLHFVLLSSI